MSSYFVKQTAIVAAPSDSNDGLDPIGFALTNASYNPSNNNLTSTGSFSSYVRKPGDSIYISSAAAGQSGLYPIESSPDADTLVLSPDPIPNSGGGITSSQSDVTSSDGPLATIDAGVQKNTGSDARTIVGVCNEGPYSVSTAITAPSQTSQNMIDVPGIVRGLDARGGTREKATIQVAAPLANTLFNQFDGWVFDTLNLDGQSYDAKCFEGYAIAIDCEVVGFNASSGQPVTGRYFHRCDIHHNNSSSYPIFLQNYATMQYCRVHHNNHGTYRCIEGGRHLTIVDNAFYRNNGYTFNIYNPYHTIRGNVFFAMQYDGLYLRSDASISAIENNVFVSNGGYGVKEQSGDGLLMMANNHFYQNASGPTNTAYFGAYTTGDPMFADTTDGAEDFSLLAGSPLLNAGLDLPGVDASKRRHIGAVQFTPDDGSGGGGGRPSIGSPYIGAA